MGEGGRSHRQFWDVNILGRKNVPSLKKSKMSRFCYVPEYLRPKNFTPQNSYDYGNKFSLTCAINKQQTTNGGVFHFVDLGI